MAFVSTTLPSFTTTRNQLPLTSPTVPQASKLGRTPRRAAIRHPAGCRPARMAFGVGSALPAFNLRTSGGGTVSNTDISNGKVIIYFYPKDATPGCTVEAGDFRDFSSALSAADARVYGVSLDSVGSHDEFAKSLDLNFPLISDDSTLCEAFEVMKTVKRGDKEIYAIGRSTFVAVDGVIVKEWRGVKSGGHAAAVVEAVSQL